ncbi:MAG TPA: hypothetical protein VFZ95_10770 [Steroidobacteraceae bacterium]
MKTALFVLACMLPSLAFAARPTPPVLTVNANQIKQLDFQWQPISGVSKYHR